MSYWTLYVRDPALFAARTGMVTNRPGAFHALTDVPPDLEALAAIGLGACYFGEDRPDLEALVWCPKRLSYTGRDRESEPAVVRAACAELEALSRRVAALEARAERRPWWRRLWKERAPAPSHGAERP